MNYLMKEFFEISKSDQFEKLDMMISTNEGYYIHDLETSSDTWFDTSFWSCLSYNAFKYLDDIQSWREIFVNQEAFKEIGEKISDVNNENGYTFIVKCTNAIGDIVTFAFIGYVLKNNSGSSKRLIGKYSLLCDIEDKELDQEHSIILRNLSHELRTPLNGILGTIQLLENTNLTEEQRSFLELNKASSEVLSNIICEILDYSALKVIEIENVNINKSKDSFCIKELLNELVLLFKPICITKRIQMELNISKTKSTIVNGDYFKWRHMLINILDNAVKYSQEGTIDIDVIIDRNHSIEILVTDNGVGMSVCFFREISKPFLREKKGLTDKIGGLGIGLATSLLIIKELNGELKIWSQTNIGVKVYIEIPIIEVG